MEAFPIQRNNVEKLLAWQWDGLDLGGIPRWVDDTTLILPRGRKLIIGNGESTVNMSDYILRTTNGQTKVFRKSEFDEVFGNGTC